MSKPYATVKKGGKQPPNPPAPARAQPRPPAKAPPKPDPRDPLEALWWILGEVSGDALLSVIQSVGWVLSQDSHSREDGSPTRERPDEPTTRELGEVLVYCAERIQDEGI